MIRLVAALALIIYSANAQYQYERLPQIYGVVGGAALNLHQSDFKFIPGVPSCCPRYTTGLGIAPFAGFIFNNELNEFLGIEVRAAYDDRSALIKANEKEWIYLNEKPYEATLSHELNVDIKGASIFAGIDLKPLNNLHLVLGGEAGYIFSMKYAQIEKITDPANEGAFSDGRRIRNDNSGNIEGFNKFHLSLAGALRYQFPLNNRKSLFLAPEISGSYPLTQLHNSLNWKALGIRAGLAVLYNHVKESYTPSDFELIVLNDIPPAPVLKAEITAMALLEGKESPNAEIVVEEFLSTKMHPILNYIFFEDSSSQIPLRYNLLKIQESISFNPTLLHNRSAIENYYEALNIIAYRMKNAPEAILTITGCNTNEGREANNLNLSKDRALAVRDYFKDVWMIPENRLSVKFRNLPEKPSDVLLDDGDEENRRVELSSNDDNILMPLITNDTLRSINIPSVRTYQNYSASLGIDEWELKLNLGDRSILSTSGSGSIPLAVEEKLSAEAVAAGEGDLTANLLLRDNSGRIASAKDTLRIERKTIRRKKENLVKDIKVDEYSLILFEFNDPKLYKRHEEPINFIKENIDSASIVTIIGYTDRTGDEGYNLRLSQERANSVAAALAKADAKVMGSGENSSLFDNELPEGRFYSRTVIVRIETPIVWK